jgi:hypothetical protein
LREYFMCVGSAFRAVDTSLNEFCMRLSDVSQPLKTILTFPVHYPRQHSCSLCREVP